MKKFLIINYIILACTCLLHAQATRKVLVEEFTGMWCGDCPKGKSAVEHLESRFGSSVICIGMHNADVLSNAYSDSIVNQCNVTEFPLGFIDRTSFFSREGVFQELADTDDWDELVKEQLNVSSPISISIHPIYSVDNRKLSVSVDTRFLKAATGHFRLNCLLMEDSIATDGKQANYFDKDPDSPWFGQGNPIRSYEQRNVARVNLAGNNWGDADVIPAEVPENGEYIKNYSYLLPLSWNASHIRVVAFVSNWGASPTILDTTHFEVLNANMEKLTVSPEPDQTTLGFSCSKPYPNPFNETCIQRVDVGSAYTPIRVSIYSVSGKLIKVLSDGLEGPGTHTFCWNGTSEDGTLLPVGLYFCRTSSPQGGVSAPMMLVR